MKTVEIGDGIIKRSHYQDGRMYNETIQDVTEIITNNKALRSERSGMGRFKNATVCKHLMHAMTIPIACVMQMRNGQCCTDGKSYDLWSNDKDEKQRALLHIQGFHRDWMTVDGNPISRKVGGEKWR